VSVVQFNIRLPKYIKIIPLL